MTRFRRVVLIAAVLVTVAAAARAVRSFLNEGASPRTKEPVGPVAPPGHAHGDARGVVPFALGSVAGKQQGLIDG